MLNEIVVLEVLELFILFLVGEVLILGVDVLGDVVIICLCYNVFKGDIIDVIDGGCCFVGDVKGVISVSIGCGGCVVLLKNVVDSELEKCGVEVLKVICEYFNYMC